jgi:hypothetical protein
MGHIGEEKDGSAMNGGVESDAVPVNGVRVPATAADHVQDKAD